MSSNNLSLLTKPIFVRGTSFELDGRKVLLSNQNRYVVLDGGLGADLVLLIKESFTTEEIVQRLANRYAPEDVYFMLMQLVRDGYLMEDALDMSPDFAQFWSSLGYQPAIIQGALSERSVGLLEIGNFTLLEMRSSLESMDVNVVDSSKKNLVVTSSYLESQLSELYLASRNTGKQYLLCKPTGSEIWIGPVIGHIPAYCWTCLAHSLELNLPLHSYKGDENTKESYSTYSAYSPEPVLKTAGGLVALETIKWLAASESFYLEDNLLSLDLKTLEIEKHACQRRTQCQHCGKKTTSKVESRVSLRPIQVNRATNFRSMPAESTLKSYQHLISPITGIIRSVSRVDIEGGEQIAHNYTVSHGGRFKMQSIESLRLATRDRSGGKGKTDVQSKTSGICEALERFSAIYTDSVILFTSSYNRIQEKAIHPNEMLLFSPTQYKDRVTWNSNHAGRFQHVPEPFIESKKISWNRVWSLTCNTTRYVPAAYCYYGYDGLGAEFCKADSNGLASGNNLEEAIACGLLELAERDAVSIWWYNRGSYPLVDLDSFSDSYFDSIRSFLRTKNRDLWVLDLTNDLEIPTFVAISPVINAETQDILLGFGAHFDARTAITRAILEVSQSLPAVSKSAFERKAQLLPDFADALDWWETATLEKNTYLLPSREFEPKSLDNYDSVESVDLKDIICSYVNHIENLGLETLVLNMTQPDIGLSVARVIVPGLRHFWRRLAPGRLYDVPVKLKWRSEPVLEEAINPVSMFL